MKSFQVYICPKCGGIKIKRWIDLNDDEKFLIEKMGIGMDIENIDQKARRFCIRCWYEFPASREDSA